jgi:hypothetical protein
MYLQKVISRKNCVKNYFFAGILKVNDEIAGSGSISKKYGSADPDPDPPQNVMDPEHCFLYYRYLFMQSRIRSERQAAAICGLTTGVLNGLQVQGLADGDTEADALLLPLLRGGGAPPPHRPALYDHVAAAVDAAQLQALLASPPLLSQLLPESQLYLQC